MPRVQDRRPRDASRGDPRRRPTRWPRELLGRLCGQEIELAGSGRTDAGVHARRQVCSFRAETVLSCEELLRALGNKYNPDPDDVERELRGALPRVQLLELTVEHMSGKRVREK